MSKKVKVSIITASSVIAVIVAAVLIMSLVKVSPMKHIKGYDRVAVLTSRQSEMAETDASKKALEKALNKTDFSVMHAVLEGKFSYAPKLVKNDDGGIAYLTVEELKNLSPKTGNQMLKFYYSSPKTITVDGVKIKYDRLIMEYGYGDGEVVYVTFTPYLESNVDNASTQDKVDENGFIGSIYYKIPQFRLRMYTSSLYDAVKAL